MALFTAFDISASGMTAERFRTDIIAQNIANVDTTRTEDGGAYRRKTVTFAEKTNTPFAHVLQRSINGHTQGGGVNVTSVMKTMRQIWKWFRIRHIRMLMKMVM